MTHVTDSLPNDPQTLKALVSAQRAEIERLKMMIAKLRCAQVGRTTRSELLPWNVSLNSLEHCEAA